MSDTSGFRLDPDPDSNSLSDQGIRVSRLIYSSASGPFRIMSGVYYGRRVAIKCLKEEYASSTAHQHLLRREGEVWASLRNPNIVQVFSVREVEGLGISIIMEYVEAPTLAVYLRNRTITFAEARRLLESICDTVAYIHSRGVIHRDLKPENILILPETRQIKIIDFGLSHGKSFADFPISGGTQNFSAPEQFDRRSPAESSADVWSIGKLMSVIYPAKDPGKKGMLLHPAARAWTLTARDCMNIDPHLRPASAAAVKSLFARRMKRYVAARILISVCTAAVLAGVIFLVTAPEDRTLHSSASAPQPLSAAASGNTLLLPVDSVLAPTIPIDSLLISAKIPPGDPATLLLAEEFTPAESVETPQESIDPFYSNDYELESYVGSADGGKFITMKLSDPVPRVFVAFLRPTIQKHFQWQINLLKTLTDQDQANLAYVGHWQYRVGAEVNSWLNKQKKAGKITSEEYLVLATFANEMLETFIKVHEEEEIKAKHQMYRRTGFHFDSHWTENYKGRNDLIVVHEFQQDGKWHEYVTYEGRKIDRTVFPPAE